MCGRFVQDTPGGVLADYFGLLTAPDAVPRYNIAPGQPVLAVLRDGPDREAVELRWGLIPSWSKEPSIGYKTFNARSETVDRTASFRSAFRARRCLVPAGGFYEWQKRADRKQPFYIYRSDRRPLAFAGLWEVWTDPGDGSEIVSCAILTTAANADLQPVHQRMPVILDEKDFNLWLDPAISDRPSLENLFRPCSPGVLSMHPVSDRVNRVENRGRECMRPSGAEGHV